MSPSMINDFFMADFVSVSWVWTLKRPGGAHGLVGEAIGLRIVDELHGDWIEIELAAEPDGGVRKMDENIGTIAVYFVEAELLACADGYVEIADLRLQFRKVFDLRRQRGWFRTETSV